MHNIHSLTAKDNAFNVGQPVPGMVFKYKLRSKEVLLQVKCDVHPWMIGYVGVVNHPYYAVSDSTGAFRLVGIPPGKQTLQVWHKAYGPLTQTVEVKAASTTKVDFTYTGNEKPAAAGRFPVQELIVPVQIAVAQ